MAEDKIDRGMLSQNQFDEIIQKIHSSEDGKVTENDFIQLVEMLQSAYYGHDPIIETFSKRSLIRNIDLICRAFSMTLKRGWKQGSNYILSTLAAASKGLTSLERKKIFVEKQLHFGDTISYWNGCGFARFYLGATDRKVSLLITHEYGTSVVNGTEAVLKSIQTLYLTEMGFNIIHDNIPIFIKDIDGYYYQTVIDENLENPKWIGLDIDQKCQFDKLWLHFEGEEIKAPSQSDHKDEITFFRKKNPYTAYKHVHRIFTSTKKELFIIDPYIDAQSITMLETLDKTVNIRWLYGKLQGDGRAAAITFRDERGNFEFRKDKELHDRYLFCDDHGYLLGGSLNKLGYKPTTLVSLGNKQTVMVIKNYFEGLWANAER